MDDNLLFRCCPRNCMNYLTKPRIWYKGFSLQGKAPMRWCRSNSLVRRVWQTSLGPAR